MILIRLTEILGKKQLNFQMHKSFSDILKYTKTCHCHFFAIFMKAPSASVYASVQVTV